METTNRSDDLIVRANEASQKFDYFITGMTGALCAYISQTFKPSILSYTPETLELISLVVLIMSLAFGFLRIHKTVDCLGHNGKYLRALEGLGQMVKNRGKQGLLNEATGEILDQQGIERKIANSQNTIIDNKTSMDKSIKYADRYFSLRNLTLVLGFLMFTVARVWSAY